MAFLGKKESEQISDDLREMIEKKVLNDLKDKMGREVVKVESINLLDYSIDEDKSNRDEIILTTISAYAKVWVKNDEFGGSSNDTFQIKNVQPIKFSFNDDLGVYKLENEAQIHLFDKSSY